MCKIILKVSGKMHIYENLLNVGLFIEEKHENLQHKWLEQ